MSSRRKRSKFNLDSFGKLKNQIKELELTKNKR